MLLSLLFFFCLTYGNVFVTLLTTKINWLPCDTNIADTKFSVHCAYVNVPPNQFDGNNMRALNITVTKVQPRKMIGIPKKALFFNSEYLFVEKKC